MNTISWKLSREKLKKLYSTSQHNIDGDTEAQVKVQAVPRLKSDLFALGKLLEGDTPYKVPVRVRSNDWVVYDMGDASKMGLGPRPTSTVIYFSDMGSGLVLFLRHPPTIERSHVW